MINTIDTKELDKMLESCQNVKPEDIEELSALCQEIFKLYYTSFVDIHNSFYHMLEDKFHKWGKELPFSYSPDQRVDENSNMAIPERSKEVYNKVYNDIKTITELIANFPVIRKDGIEFVRGATPLIIFPPIKFLDDYVPIYIAPINFSDTILLCVLIDTQYTLNSFRNIADAMKQRYKEATILIDRLKAKLDTFD